MAGVLLVQLPRTQLDRPQLSQIQVPSRGKEDADLRFYTGKVVSKDGKYVLEAESPGGPYLLDDQGKARPYEGKHVRVIGVLEVASNTLHVREIEEAAG
jgi:hypothetical protein